MRVLYLSRSYTPHDHRFLAAIGAGGHQAYFLPLQGRQVATESRPLPAGVEQIRWRAGKGLREALIPPGAVMELRRVLARLQPDLVHAGPVQLGAFLAALAGARPLVTMSWGSDMLLGARRGLGRWAARWTLRRSAVFLCDCQAVARVAQGLDMPPERIRVFPWGVDLDHFQPGGGRALRQQLKWDDCFIALSTRNLEPVYGVETLVQGFVRAAQEEPSLRLLMLGQGSLASRIKTILAQQGMLERVHFAGLVGFDALPEYYRAADVYVSASHSDGSSISLLEAMASGLPAIVSDIPGNREWVSAEHNGWLFPPGDSHALARALLEARAQRQKLAAIARAARALAEQQADWRRNQGELLKAYELALALEGGAR